MSGMFFFGHSVELLLQLPTVVKVSAERTSCTVPPDFDALQNGVINADVTRTSVSNVRCRTQPRLASPAIDRHFTGI